MAQNFQPFNSASKKLYQDSAGNTYSSAIQNAASMASDSVFIPMLNLNNDISMTDNCQFGVAHNVTNKIYQKG